SGLGIQHGGGRAWYVALAARAQSGMAGDDRRGTGVPARRPHGAAHWLESHPQRTLDLGPLGAADVRTPAACSESYTNRWARRGPEPGDLARLGSDLGADVPA